jgi:hypothetical protein
MIKSHKLIDIWRQKKTKLKHNLPGTGKINLKQQELITSKILVFSFQYPLKSFSFKDIPVLSWSVNFNTKGLMSLE